MRFQRVALQCIVYPLQNKEAGKNSEVSEGEDEERGTRHAELDDDGISKCQWTGGHCSRGGFSW